VNREYHRWYSPLLGRDMELLLFGHAGARVLVFPPSMGRFYDWEDRGMIAALQPHLDNGWVQLYCVDSVDAESWYNQAIAPAERARRHSQYDQYLVDEVLPFSLSKNSNPYLITVGASFGAYHAVNFGLRHPEHADRLIGLSGLYDISRFANGSADDTVYFNNPMAFLANEHEPERLRLLRELEIILAIGRDDANSENNVEFANLLARQRIPHVLRLWDGWAHDWPYWQRMVQLYLGGDPDVAP